MGKDAECVEQPVHSFLKTLAWEQKMLQKMLHQLQFLQSTSTNVEKGREGVDVELSKA